MKKIMFNDKYGLTKAVLDGSKTQTRRFIKGSLFTARHWNPCLEMPHCYYKDNRGLCQLIRPNGELVTPKYDIGEKVAIAQNYKTKCYEQTKQSQCSFCNLFEGETDSKGSCENRKGWNNKMFVRAELMLHHIEITNVRVERLQDISDEDCIDEGIIPQFRPQSMQTKFYIPCSPELDYNSPREAYAALIDKLSGKGTWESNPFVFVYEFKLVD